ncbi:MAG: TAXI family TRAP transporter solute-binding subunit [Sterolibacterium sp.]|nr:TAXI family TRAP transporter solute-binding subunit [Sterolibacterium sp.]
MVRKIPRRLSEISLRDLLFVALPSLLLLAAGFWAAAQFIRPAPPRQIILSSGGEGGAYQRFAARYKEVLARYDIELVEKPSAGSLENLQRLRDEKFEVDAGFIQGGTARADANDSLASLGSLYYEPLWIFYRADLAHGVAGGALDRLGQLKGRRIAVGARGSGTYKLALELLEANGVAEAPTQLIETGGVGVVEALQQGKVDAAFVVGPTQSAAVWLLLFSDGVRLMSLSHAEAYARLFPHLTKLTLPRGGIDLMRDMPPQDVSLVSPMATLVVREDIHPALVDLLLQAASEVHGDAGLFQKAGEFPRPARVDFPISSEAERYYKSGKPFLQRYLPFWAATLIDRLVVMLVPLIALLIPILKFAPALYGWRVRSRIFKRYGEMKFIEAEVELEPNRHTREEWLARLDRIEADVNRMQTPLPFSDMLYNLRGHIGLVREAIQRKTCARLSD